MKPVVQLRIHSYECLKRSIIHEDVLVELSMRLATFKVVHAQRKDIVWFLLGTRTKY
jgi:hypothetical protein